MNKKIFALLSLTALILGAVLFFQSRPDQSSSSENHHSETEINESETVSTSPKEDSLKKVDPSKAILEDEFLTSLKEELKVAHTELPTTSDMKGLSDEEVHHTPKAITQSGKLLGRLLDQAEQNPARRKETLKFLLGCAEDSELVPAVRAVCWKSVMNQIPKWKVFVPISGANVSNEVKELASRLP